MLKFIWVSILIFAPNGFADVLSGNWKLVSGEFIDKAGQSIEYESLNLSAIKVLTDTHFSFVTQSGEDFWAAGAGKYTAVDDWYIENPNLSSFNANPNKLYKFQYRIEQDKWILERWEAGKRVEFEVWQRF